MHCSTPSVKSSSLKSVLNLINAFAVFIKKHPDYKLVLTGSDKGNKAYVQSYVEQLGMKDKVVFTGFVENVAINTFYKNATAMTMATFFGPTNMPPLEAMHIGCPVICSDIAGHREQLGDAALYFDARDSKALTQCMEEVVANRDKYAAAIEKQKEKATFTIEEALRRINQYMVELIAIRSAWK